MAEITPARPRSEGAVIAWMSDVPTDWDVLYAHGAAFSWQKRWSIKLTADYLVEARPPRPRMVAVKLPEDDVRLFERASYVHDTAAARLSAACAAALAELDAEQ